MLNVPFTRHPDWFPSFFTWFMLLLFVIRYVMYKKSKYHLFMLDFCYVVNISCMLQAYFQPNCLPWFKANFALCMGPLCMAILTWHNSLVFHSLEKLTSFFLHAFPPMLCHLYRYSSARKCMLMYRWHLIGIFCRWRLIPTEAISHDMEWKYGELFWPALGMYIAWQVTYLFLTGKTHIQYMDVKNEQTVMVSCSHFRGRLRQRAGRGSLAHNKHSMVDSRPPPSDDQDCH